MALFAITTIDRDDPGRPPGSTAVTFRSGAGAQDANVFIPLDVAYRHSTQGHQLAPRLKQSPSNGEMTGNATQKATFRSITWAYRFWRACHHPSLRATQVALGAARIGIACGLRLTAHPGTVGIWFTSEQGVALLLDEHVNRPGHVSGTLEQAIADVLAKDAPPDPSRWTDADEANLINAYVTRRDATNMTDPAGRAQHIVQFMLAGKLSDRRGSFVS